MKIRLLVDVPVDKNHGLTKGKVFDASIEHDVDRIGRHVWAIAETGIPVKLFGKEYEIVVGNGR